jgi:hypothetical protein
MDIKQNILVENKKPFRSLVLNFFKIAVLLISLVSLLQAKFMIEGVIFTIFSIISFIFLWSDFINKQFVQNKDLYIKIVKSVPIIAAIIVCLFMTPVLIGVFYEDIALLKMIGFFNTESDLNTQGIFVNIFGGLIIVGLFFYIPIITRILEVIFYKKNIRNLYHCATLNFIISACGGILYIILNTLNIMDGITRLVLFFSICIPMVSTSFGYFVLIITLFILSIIKTMRAKGENKISK